MYQLRAIFFQGLRDAAKLRLALPLYFAGLVLGLLQSWPVVFGLTTGQLGHLNLQRLLDDSDTLIGLLSQNDVAPLVGWWVLLLPLLSLAYGLFYNLFSGGILSVWDGRREFWAGSWRFFLPFTGLGLLLVCAALIIMGITGVAAATISGAATATLFLGALLLQLLNLVGEYARSIGVVRDRRNPLVLFGAAIRFCAQHPAVFGLGLGGLVLQLGLAAAYIGLTRIIGGSPVSIVIDQVFVFAWLWAKLLRLAWARAFVVQVEDERRTTNDERLTPLSAIDITQTGF